MILLAIQDWNSNTSKLYEESNFGKFQIVVLIQLLNKFLEFNITNFNISIISYQNTRNIYPIFEFKTF